MLAYILAVTYTYFLTFVARHLPRSLRLLSTAPLILFATFRGQSGKDTPLYLARFRNFDFELATFATSIDSEPLFSAIVGIAKAVAPQSPEMMFFLHATILTWLFVEIANRYEAARLYLLTVGPMFLVDGLTNGMRIGLAYHLVIAGFIFGYRYLWYTLGFCTHLSSPLSIWARYFGDSLDRNFPIRDLALNGIGFAGTAVALLNLAELAPLLPRATAKLAAYSGLTLETSYSGTADLFILGGLLVLRGLYDDKWHIALLLYLTTALVLCLSLFTAIQESLVFIRLIKLLIVGLCFSQLLTRSPFRLPSAALLAMGALYSLNYLRQVAFDPGMLPYGQ